MSNSIGILFLIDLARPPAEIASEPPNQGGPRV
jgi:hypothetical protein